LFGTQTNNHIESFHRVIKREIKRSMSLHQTIQVLVDLVEEYSRRETANELKNMKTSTNVHVKKVFNHSEQSLVLFLNIFLNK
jgi:transposase-like protein